VNTFPEGLHVWVSDSAYRRRADGLIKRTAPGRWPEEEATAARWIHTAALRLFPDGAYARLHPVANDKLLKAADD